jgi:BNR repeat-like domain
MPSTSTRSHIYVGVLVVIALTLSLLRRLTSATPSHATRVQGIGLPSLEDRSVRPLLRTAAILLAVLVGLSLWVPSPSLAISWGPIRPIAADDQGIAWPGSTVAFSGGVAVAYRHIVAGEYGSYIRMSADGGTTWTAPTQLSAVGTLSSRPALAAAGNTIDAVFTQSTDDGATSRVVYRTSANGGTTWSSRIALSPTGTQAGFPTVARFGSQVVVAWTNAVTGKVGVRTSDTGGATFNPRTDLAMTTNQPFVDVGDVSLEAWATVGYSEGIINLAFRTSDSTLKLRRSEDNGGSWTPALALAHNVDGAKPSMAEHSGTVFIAYTVDPTSTSNGHVMYRRSTNTGRSWSAPAAFSSGSEPPSGAPVVSWRSSRWTMAFSRCMDDGCSETQVYFRSSYRGTSWGTASQVTTGPGDFQDPVGLTKYGHKAIVVFNSVDASGTLTNVLVRTGT